MEGETGDGGQKQNLQRVCRFGLAIEGAEKQRFSLRLGMKAQARLVHSKKAIPHTCLCEAVLQSSEHCFGREPAMERTKPRIGITLGDVAGIGPEIALKALRKEEVWERCTPILIGSASVVAHYGQKILPDWSIQVLGPPFLPGSMGKKIPLLDLNNIDFSRVRIGQIAQECGRAALEYIQKAVELCGSGELDALVTCPIHKESVQLAGIQAPGHTEYLARLCGVQEVRMLLVVGHLRAMHLTTHLSLKQAIEAVQRERIVETIRWADRALRQLGLAERRIAVPGLNPHAGENGLFGQEELEEIIPAIELARQQGFKVSGPIPPDTVFFRMDRGEFDLVVALYHDQGHIPLKLAGFDRGVNVTIGLPIIRTSVDHGTAFDIAGRLTASPQSLIEAIDLAARMAENRRD
jgi:4-hydroxythreonine-4-phosphate dehydrogenase